MDRLGYMQDLLGKRVELYNGHGHVLVESGEIIDCPEPCAYKQHAADYDRPQPAASWAAWYEEFAITGSDAAKEQMLLCVTAESEVHIHT